MSLPLVTYTLVVKTKDIAAGGIVSDVFVKVNGEKQSLKPFVLDTGSVEKQGNKSHRFPFARNSKSNFHIVAEDCGDVEYIEVWHNASRAWALDYLDVQKGKDSWVHRPKEGIPPQGEKRTHTRIKGEHVMSHSGASKFHMSAKAGDIVTMETMLTSGQTTVDKEDGLGRTALHYAVLYGQVGAAELLLKYRADIRKADFSGKTSLHHACMNHLSNDEIVAMLIREFRHPSAGVSELQEGLREDPQTAITKYIETTDQFGKTALHYAASYGFVGLMKILQKNAGSVLLLSRGDHTMQTPLHCAAIQGEARASKALIDMGADFSARDHEQKTFLHHAATAGHHEYLRDVLTFNFRGGKKDQLRKLCEVEDGRGMTPLLCAAADGSLETVKMLSETLECNVFHTDKQKSNALHHGAARGGPELLSYLSHKLDINGTNDFDITPLHVATHSSNVPGVRWLLANKADAGAKNVAMETALEIATTRKDEVLVRLLQNAHSLAMEKKAPRTQLKEAKPPTSTYQASVPLQTNRQVTFRGDTVGEASEEETGDNEELLQEIAYLRSVVLRQQRALSYAVQRFPALKAHLDPDLTPNTKQQRYPHNGEPIRKCQMDNANCCVQ